MRPLRRELQLVFQDPFGSLSPAHDHRADHHRGPPDPRARRSPPRERDRRAGEALAEVGLKPDMRNRYPHEFSGGQRQRIAIARAMILKPKVIVLDEPTSALDRSVQKQIVELLRDLQAAHGLSYLFISHDLAVVRAVSDYIIVMKSGPDRRGGPDRGDLRPPAGGVHPDADGRGAGHHPLPRGGGRRGVIPARAAAVTLPLADGRCPFRVRGRLGTI